MQSGDGNRERPHLAARGSILHSWPCGRITISCIPLQKSPFAADRKPAALSRSQSTPAPGKLTRLNEQSSRGAGPSHIVVDRSGRNVLVANYEGGTAAVLPIAEDGRLRPASSVVVHRGRGINPSDKKRLTRILSTSTRPTASRSCATSGSTRSSFTGSKPVAGMLTHNEPAFATVAPGSGPRHLAFHPSGRFVYVINELASTITAFWYEPENGALSSIQTISTLPGGFKGINTAAEVVVHPSGKFVYGSNRGNDSIAIFSVDATTGRLSPVGHESTRGKTPRNFAIDPTGSYLLAANQDSNNVVVFRVDKATGRLQATGQVLKIHEPGCIRYVAR